MKKILIVMISLLINLILISCSLNLNNNISVSSDESVKDAVTKYDSTRITDKGTVDVDDTKNGVNNPAPLPLTI